MTEVKERKWPADNVERWAEVPGHVGYEVSTTGRIRSVDRVLSDGRTWSGRILKQKTNRRGYFSVCLSLGKKRQYRHAQVHRLMAEAFFCNGRFDRYMQTRHLNGIPSDNRLSNLSIGTAKENAEDRDSHGTTACLKGSLHSHAKLTEQIVADARKRHKTGESASSIASDYGVSKWTMFDALSGRTWGHVA